MNLNKISEMSETELENVLETVSNELKKKLTEKKHADFQNRRINLNEFKDLLSNEELVQFRTIIKIKDPSQFAGRTGTIMDYRGNDYFGIYLDRQSFPSFTSCFHKTNFEIIDIQR